MAAGGTASGFGSAGGGPAGIEALLAAYQITKDQQHSDRQEKELARFNRDQLIQTLNHRRTAIQPAADALWPWAEETNRPIRKTFHLPLNRPLGL